MLVTDVAAGIFFIQLNDPMLLLLLIRVCEPRSTICMGGIWITAGPAANAPPFLLAVFTASERAMHPVFCNRRVYMLTGWS